MARQIKLRVSLAITVMVTVAVLSVATGTAAAAEWVDHFEGGLLDESRWTIEAWDRANPEFGTPGFIPNNHVGYYVAEHVTLANGSLSLRLTQAESTIDGTLWVVSSGALIFTKETYGYGTYEWRMRMSSTAAAPYDPGSPTSGNVSAGFIYVNNSETEIDFEFSGHVLPPQDADPSNDERLYMGNWHNQDPSTDPNEVTESTFSKPTVPGINSDFHTYKFIWEEGKITFYVDGDVKATHTTDVPSAPAHFMINHWGTNNSNGFGGGATIGVDRYFHVDWVKFTPQPPPPPGPPAAPSNLTATVKSSGKGKNKIVQEVLLAWQDNSTNEDSFIIGRCEVVGRGKNKTCDFVQLDSVGGNSSSYHDFGVTVGTRYRYRVKARNANGDSPYSNIAQAKAP